MSAPGAPRGRRLPRVRREDERRARVLALVAGLALVVLGLLGTGVGARPGLVVVEHPVVHLAVGAVGVLAALRTAAAVTWLVAGGIAHLLLWVLDSDTWVPLATGLVLVALGVYGGQEPGLRKVRSRRGRGPEPDGGGPPPAPR